MGIGLGTLVSFMWPGPDRGARGPRARGPRALASRTPEGARERDPWPPLIPGPLLLAEHASQALPWPGDWIQRGCTGWDAWSRVSPAPGPAPFAASPGVAGQNAASSAGDTHSWSRAPAPASSPGGDDPLGSDSAAYWTRGLCAEERRADCVSWGAPGGSDCPASWDSGLHAACTASPKGYQSSDLTTSSEPQQQLDRAILARYPKTNHRGERSGRLGPEGAELESSGAGLDAEGAGTREIGGEGAGLRCPRPHS